MLISNPPGNRVCRSVCSLCAFCLAHPSFTLRSLTGDRVKRQPSSKLRLEVLIVARKWTIWPVEWRFLLSCRTIIEQTIAWPTFPDPHVLHFHAYFWLYLIIPFSDNVWHFSPPLLPRTRMDDGVSSEQSILIGTFFLFFFAQREV